jgi:hypothetical protein
VSIDWAKVAAEARLEDRYLLVTSDPTMSAEPVALGYKSLTEAERAFRTMKTSLDLRPVYHRLDERIRAHVLLFWLALLLVRVASGAPGTPGFAWPASSATTFVGPAGQVAPTSLQSSPSSGQRP